MRTSGLLGGGAEEGSKPDCVRRAYAFRDTEGPIEAASNDGATAIAVTPGYEGPHMIESSIVCGRCHGIAGQPGEHVGLGTGQAVVCLSCHAGGGQALRMPILPAEGSTSVGVNPSTTTGLGRSHPWGVSAVNVDVGSSGPPPESELALYLDGGDIKCATCHEQHNSDADSPYLRAPNARGSMCRQCHTEHLYHTPAGSWKPVCEDCHDMHDLRNENLSLVATVVENQTLGVDQAVVFTSETGPNSFSDGLGADDGICQVCHVDTDYHVHNGSGTAHYEGEDCTNCHQHQSGFMPPCAGCHASVQDDGDGIPAGGRRAITGEFPVGDVHAHYGTTLDDQACLVCHSTATHKDGYVELVDPDDGSIYRFLQPTDLASDPDLSDFCSGCHDADGATRLAAPMDPFGDGNAPPDVASRFMGSLQWVEEYSDGCFGTGGTLRSVNSHHDISDADQAFSGAKLECLNCHGAHTSGASQPISDPFDTLTPWTGEMNGFCLACHEGGLGPADPGFPLGVTGPSIALVGIDSCDYQDPMWYSFYDWTHSAHGLDSKRAWTGYSGAPAAVVDCTVCHDPHGSYTPTNTAGNPYMIRDFVDGTAFVDDGSRDGGFNGPPFETYGTAREVVVPASGVNVGWGDSQGLCVVCHADWVPAMWAHDMCGACQTCHSHGSTWGEYDWEGDNDTPCPAPPPGRAGVGTTSSSGSNESAWPLDPRQLRDADLTALQEVIRKRISNCTEVKKPLRGER
jgi:hypothetical protein